MTLVASFVMVPSISRVRDEARKTFLGRNHVIGVGIVNGKARRIAFLLDVDCNSTRIESESWASQHAVRIDFIVVGSPTAALLDFHGR